MGHDDRKRQQVPPHGGADRGGDGRASDPFHRRLPKQQEAQRPAPAPQQREVIMNSADCIAKYKNHYISKET